MAKRRTKSAFDNLGGVMDNRSRGRRKKAGPGLLGKGLGGAMKDRSRRRGKKGRGMLGALDSGLGVTKRSRRADRGWRMARDAGESIRRRLTRTERIAAEEDVKRALENDQALGEYTRDLNRDESFINRLTRLVADRVGLWRNGK